MKRLLILLVASIACAHYDENILQQTLLFPLHNICFSMVPEREDKQDIYKNLVSIPNIKGPDFPWRNPIENITEPDSLTARKSTVITPGIPNLPFVYDGEVKVFNLIAQPVKQTIVNERDSLVAPLIPEQNTIPHKLKHVPRLQNVKCWGFNGSSPGPTIEAYEGDRIRIVVKNELPEPTSVHWHGLIVPNDMDGAAPETQKPIMPGESFNYEFTLKQSGTLMYHSGYNVLRQDHMGLNGMLIIHPREYEQKPDKQFVFMLQQWAIPAESPYINLMTMEFNWFTFNGRSAPNIPPLIVKQGDLVRLRFGNLIMASHPIHLHGFVWEEVGTEGGPIPLTARIKGSTINVPPGTTRDVEFIADNPGLWRLHCHKLHHIVNAHAQMPMGYMEHGGMFTLLKVEPRVADSHELQAERKHEVYS